ncbi:MAG TPA: hypothetical protein VGM87_01020 [Roseomonas sp.]
MMLPDTTPVSPTLLSKKLLQHLEMPLGTANVRFEKDAWGGKLVVLHTPDARLPRERMPSTFAGVRVVYRPRRPAPIAAD